MRAVIVDTDVVSFIFKGDTRGDLYEPHLTGALASISFMTVAELEQWVIARNWGARRHGELLRFLKQRFTVIDSSGALCRKWAEVREQVRQNGRIIQVGDAWLAASALLYGIPLVTHNAADFAGIAGLIILSESEP
jgi:tRNA(fMet)-specific endonuclease VapC